MRIRVDEYFDTTPRPSVLGLSLFLGFNSRQALHNYASYSDEFNDVITRARARVEQFYEEQLLDRDAARGAIFALQNMGWVQQTNVVGVLSVQDLIVQLGGTGDQDECH